MVINVFHVDDVGADKPKHDSPVGANGNGPKALQTALQRMQPEARQVHVRGGSRRIEASENVAQLFRMIRGHAAGVVILEEPLESLVADREDDQSSVMRNVTHVKYKSEQGNRMNQVVS